MVKIIDSIRDELSSDSEVECTDWNEFQKQSIVHCLFCGRYKNVITCKECNSNSSKYEPFYYLSIPVPLKQQKAKEGELNQRSISDVLNNKLFGVQQKMNDKTCDSCGRKECCEKVDTIVNLPPILIVHLNRFFYAKKRTMKKHTDMEFDYDMNLSGTKYSLKSVICHSGNSSYGHYWA